MPFNTIRLAATLAVALAAPVLACPAAARTPTATFHHTGGGTYWPPTNGLVVLRSGGVEARDLIITGGSWSATFGVGRGCHDPGGTPQSVHFYNRTGRHTGGQDIATACTYWASDLVGGNDNLVGPRVNSDDDNRNDDNDDDTVIHPATPNYTHYPRQTIPGSARWRSATGVFTTRIYGKVCTMDGSLCSQFGDGGTLQGGSSWETAIDRSGYRATFTPGKHCGPPRWPTPGTRNLEPYAEWCDFTVEVK